MVPYGKLCQLEHRFRAAPQKFSSALKHQTISFPMNILTFKSVFLVANGSLLKTKVCRITLCAELPWITLQYHMTNVEVGMLLKLPFPLSKFRAAKITAISLSTVVAGYGLGKWIHICRLQAPLLTLDAEFRPERLLFR